MRFILIDKIVEFQPNARIETVKALSLAEEYLGDHFPDYPVLPGVLMVEALVQSAAMLVHLTNDFSHSMVVLAEARNVKYKSFVRPGNLMRITVEAKSIEAEGSSFTASACVDNKSMVEARLKLRHFNLSEKDKSLADVDARIVKEMKNRARMMGAG